MFQCHFSKIYSNCLKFLSPAYHIIVSHQFSKMTSVDISMQTVAAEAAKRLVKLALDGGSFDDISVLVNVYVWRE